MSHPPAVTRHQVLDILENQWPQYHARLREMDDDDLLDWADSQGYARPQDVLAHINGWFEEMLKIVPIVMRGDKYQRDWATIDEFNARVVKHARDHSLDYALNEGERLRAALHEVISALNDETVANNYLNRWLYGTIVEHLHEHALP